MKNLIFLWAIFSITVSCVGSDTEFLPADISEAREKKLLIHVYKPTSNKITINRTEYLIQEVFTTFKYNSKNDQRINKNFFALSIKIKDLKTNQKGLSVEDSDHSRFINFHCDFCGGLNNDNIVMYYNDISKRNTLDSVKIGFKNYKNHEQLIYLIKK
ncbi:hypothetical protein [Chryseobacterium sp. LAM-KRS1]|uniref:hypothetical protein n=1 Tax=Chryseobacterium sp. LAM-KRS1 TaxID=2715754 RepID=UPI0015535D75|nr:hypothetical protein [Chryseobacterium sp. LAM-KRS1]